MMIEEGPLPLPNPMFQTPSVDWFNRPIVRLPTLTKRSRNLPQIRHSSPWSAH
jgi:hypothetical protein